MSVLASERKIVLLIGAVQFFNILDFMMVMPLGPDFAAALGIPTSHIGYIGGAYTLAASAAGLLGSLFLDRFDRKPALVLALLGLTCGTFAGAFATGFATLLAARFLAGAFGGPATSLSLSIIADVVPPERRGKAMGAVMGAFSVASVLGVPAGLELARRGGWRMPFLLVAFLGLAISIVAMRWLPPLRHHLQGDRGRAHLRLRPTVLLSFAMTASVMMASFILIPNLSPYLIQNLGYPRAHLGLLYMVGGSASFVTMRIAGRLVDRFGSFAVGGVAALGLAVLTYFWFAAYSPIVPVMVLFTSFMILTGFRNVSYNTLTSKVPEGRERASFMSIQSAVQHMAAAMGAFLSAHLLSDAADHRLIGIDIIAFISMALTLALPVLLRLVERRVVARNAAEQPAVSGANPLSANGQPLRANP